MRRTLWTVCTSAVLAILSGCATGPLLDNPLPVRPAGVVEVEQNPVFVGQGPVSYRKVYEHAERVLIDFGFEILESAPYEGRIETLPRIAPGLLTALKPGSPDPYERLLATLQTYRHRAVVRVQPAGPLGGFFVHVTVYKELEDLPRPVRATAGAANFRVDNNLERQYSVVDPTVFEANWIPRGRDVDIEQILLQRLKEGFCEK
jgi:hypothetical protein